MKNKYKAAGVMNIVCGVIYTLIFVGVFVLLNLGFILGSEEAGQIESGIVFSVLFTLVSAYIWEAMIIFPFFMILTGIEMCSKRKKGWGVILLIVFNILFKIWSAAMAAMLIFFIPFAIVLFISVCMDVYALFRKEKTVITVKKR